MNAFQGVRMVREAVDMWAEVPPSVRGQVVAAAPSPVRDDPKTDDDDWGVAVVLLAKPGEHLATAAERVALYVTLHAERYHVTPSLARLVRAAQATT